YNYTGVNRPAAFTFGYNITSLIYSIFSIKYYGDMF
ncbi:MAG: hypothetical protein Hyperionvirus5_125, partial [Hyperionvirus sp.]